MWANTGQEEDLICYSRTSITRTSIIRISRLSGLFIWSQFGYDYLLVTIKIRSHILFKTTALKGAVKCKGFLLFESKKPLHLTAPFNAVVLKRIWLRILIVTNK